MEVSLLGLVLGAVVGLILALAGAGGGILAVPLLVFGLHLTIMQAAPVGLIAVGAASAFGAVLGLREGMVRYRAAALIGITGMLLAPLGVRLARLIPNQPLMVAFAIVLAWVALRMFKQAPTVAHNLLVTRGAAKGEAKYDGYGSCPLTVARGKIVLAEFTYGGKVAPSFPKWLIDGTRPSTLAWYLKERILPPLYWQAMLKGREWLAQPEMTN